MEDDANDGVDFWRDNVFSIADDHFRASLNAIVAPSEQTERGADRGSGMMLGDEGAIGRPSPALSPGPPTRLMSPLALAGRRAPALRRRDTVGLKKSLRSFDSSGALTARSIVLTMACRATLSTVSDTSSMAVRPPLSRDSGLAP